ncbi:MAG: ribonuclease III [Acidobacteriia bacterium]|nr:ribonuclease III [Terriglobia bacterium]
MVRGDTELRRLADRLGHCFRDLGRLRLALTHRSAVLGAGGSNERLEFLGDTVLDLCLSDVLLERFPDAGSGELTKLKSLHVSNERLADIAGRLELAEYLQVGGGQSLVGDRTEQRLLANAFEAVLGAVYLDGGIAAAKRVVAQCMFSGDLSDALDRSPEEGNHKAALQEWLQGRQRERPRYAVVHTEGSDNRPTFFVEARSGDLVGTGTGPTKRAAESEAAARLLRMLMDSEASETISGAGVAAGTGA